MAVSNCILIMGIFEKFGFHGNFRGPGTRERTVAIVILFVFCRLSILKKVHTANQTRHMARYARSA